MRGFRKPVGAIPNRFDSCTLRPMTTEVPKETEDTSVVAIEIDAKYGKGSPLALILHRAKPIIRRVVRGEPAAKGELNNLIDSSTMQDLLLEETIEVDVKGMKALVSPLAWLRIMIDREYNEEQDVLRGR